MSTFEYIIIQHLINDDINSLFLLTTGLSKADFSLIKIWKVLFNIIS